MATEFARALYSWFVQTNDTAITYLDPLDYPFPWPAKNRALWPRADISGHLASGEVFIIEVDDQSEPQRNIIKYWPLLHGIKSGDITHPPISFVHVSARNKTCGEGYQLLSRFIGEQLQQIHTGIFCYHYVDLTGKDVSRVAESIMSFIRSRANISRGTTEDPNRAEFNDWPQNFFDAIQIEDPGFCRSTQGKATSS